MGCHIRYTQEFKLGAMAQLTDKGHSVTSVAGRLGVSTKPLMRLLLNQSGRRLTETLPDENDNNRR